MFLCRKIGLLFTTNTQSNLNCLFHSKPAFGRIEHKRPFVPSRLGGEKYVSYLSLCAFFLTFFIFVQTILVKKIFLFFISFLAFNFLHAQIDYWQQQVNFIIDVRLNDVDHSLEGFEKIEYINNSPDTLHFIWFHLWPNAYKNDKTAYSDQDVENGRTNFYFSDKNERGYINRLDFRINGEVVKTEDHPQHIDIIKLILTTPLAPHTTLNITTPFHVQLPHNFSRSGHQGQSYQVTQWYPKPAVYDK